MRAVFLTSVLALSLSGCAYYPDLYSIDTSQLRAKACAGAAFVDPMSSRKFNENCTGTSEASENTQPPIRVEYETEETRTTRRTAQSGETSDEVEETEWVKTTNTPIPFETYDSVLARANPLTPLEMAIVQASWLQDKYEVNYREVSKIRDILELPVLVAAGAAGLVLVDGGFFDEGNETRRAAEIAVIAGTFEAGKGALNSPNMAEYYVRGHGALNCAIAWGMPFTTAGNSPEHTAFNTAVREQGEAINILERLFAVVSIDDPNSNQASNDAARKVLESARQVARTTLKSARTSRNTALAELAAFNGATTAFQLEVSQIRTSANYGNITNSFNQQPESPPDSSDNKDGLEQAGDGQLSLLDVAAGQSGVDLDTLAAGSITHADLAALTGALAEILLNRTSDLSGYSPGYSTAISNLNGCSGNVAIPSAAS